MKTYLKALFVLILTVFFFNQGYRPNHCKRARPTKSAVTAQSSGKFVDNDNNGICDNHELKGKDRKCANFVDKDGNGICDNCTKLQNAARSADCPGIKMNSMEADRAKWQQVAECHGKGTGEIAVPAQQVDSGSNSCRNSRAEEIMLILIPQQSAPEMDALCCVLKSNRPR